MIIRGQIYLADLNNNQGSQMQKIRPVVVIQNNTGNELSPTVIVACMTANTHNKMRQPTHVFLKGNNKGMKNSIVLCEQLFTIDKNQLISYKGKLKETEILKLNTALKISIGLY